MLRLLLRGGGAHCYADARTGVVGLYGVVSLIVSQRTHEIGIRMAIGARSSDVMRIVFRSTLRLVAVGVAIGMGGGLAFAKVLAVALIGIKPFDLVAFASTSVLMALVAVLATWGPARRAARVDPMVALRNDWVTIMDGDESKQIVKRLCM